jgi:2-dehydro-3-deoxygalactonokinase
MYSLAGGLRGGFIALFLAPVAWRMVTGRPPAIEGGGGRIETGWRRMTDWIAADWGTSHLRVWGMAQGDVVWQASSDAGMGTLTPGAFEAAFREAARGHLDGPAHVVICGMAGARQGWAEAPYAAVPCVPLAAGLTRVQNVGARLTVDIVGGLKQSQPADVMRGEETQIAGFLALNPAFDGVLCLPGSHSKWVEISAGEVIGFRTFMTGEMFAALSRHTVLRHSVGTEGWDADAFEAALSDTLSRPEKLAAALFGIRAEGLLAGLTPQTARARLSGLLIGAELAAARAYWLGRQVAVIGAGTVVQPYVHALRLQGLPVTQADAEAMVIKGLARAHALGRAQTEETAP